MKKPKITLDTIEQTFDLREFSDADFTLESSLKEQIAQAIIDRIASRTEDGKAFGGGNLKKPYSKEYQHSREFKAAGKKPNEITMELTGDMVASMQVGATDGNRITIEITDDLQIKKAYNHQTGDTVPKRPWFGLTKKEMQEIVDSFASDIAQASESPGTTDLNPETSKKLTLLDMLDEED